MLTSPSDSLPQIVCPMDEHAIPSNSFCSTPPHSEPPPPLLPLSSITPSGAKNGTSGHRRSSRIQEIRAQTPQKESVNKDGPAETPSPKKRQIESVNMGSQSKQPRVEDSHVHENQKEVGFDSCAAECQNKQKQQKSHQEEPNISAVENTVEQFAVDAAQTADSTKSDMETCGRLAVGHAFEDASAPKGWVIGPLFQSLKMKMATFTEIVMSPVKLFRANSPPLCTDHPDKLEEFELHAGGASDVENSEPSATFLTEAQSENGNLEAEANQPGHSQKDSVALKCSKILSFDVELPTHSFTQASECAIKEKNSPVSVPLQCRHSPCIESEDASVSSGLSQPSVDVSATHVGDMEDQKCNITFRRKPPPGKCTENSSGVKKVPSKTSAAKVKKEECDVSDEQFPLMDLVRTNKADAQSDCPSPDGGEDGRQIESLVCLNDNANGRALKLSSNTQQLNPETFSAAGLGRAKRDCHPQNSVKRKRLTEDTFTGDTKRQELLNVASDSGVLRSPSKGVVSTDPIVNGNLEAEANQPGHSQVDSVALTCLKKLLFDVELPTHSFTQAGEHAIKEKNSPVSVPLQRRHSPCIESEDASASVKSSILSQPSVDVSASHVGAMEDQKCNMTLRRKPPPGKCTESRSGVKKVPSKTSAARVKKEGCDVSDEQFPLMDLVRTNKADAQKRKRVVSTDPVIDVKEALMPAGKRPVSTRANKKGKGGQEIQSALNTQTDGSSDAMLVYSLDKISGESETNQKGISSKAKPSALCKRLKTRTGVGGAGLTFDNSSLALETSVAIASTKQAEQEALAELLRRPAIKPLQSTSKRRNISTKPLKRKSQNLESDSTLFSTSSVTDLNISKEEISKKQLNQPSKRAKKGFKNAVQSSASGGNQDMKQCVSNLHLTAKENQPEEGKDKLSVDSVYFEMTPFVSIQPVPSLSQPNLECYVQLDKDIKLVASNERVSGLRSSSRRVNNKPRRDDNQRRKGRVLQSRTQEADEVTNCVTLNDADLSTGSSRSAGSGLSKRLMRSYSCPEIPSFRPHDTPWTSSVHSPHHSRIHPPRHLQFSHSPLVQLTHKSLPRTRRHTVCSVEVEREIAPLCLRKEVYPTRRSLPFDRASQHFPPSLALSPSTSLSALASCFLSSPLAFLSKKVESRGASSSPSTSSHVSSPTSSSSTYPKIFLQRIDSSSTSTVDCSSSTNLLECEIERRQSEEEDDGEDTSSSSQEFEDVTLREEKALSDSEIKVQKHKERGKVSSIKIRRTLPKAQNNLTPMGLPKLVRLNKKEFSLEEIYTNKNFTKAPESRLETIFEVPLKHRNGSESWFGQRRFKRFLEFVDSSKVRKPKKQLVGVGKSGVSSSRTRRGGFPKDEPQDLDSLLCAKLNQLNLWVTRHQTDS